MKSPFEGKTPSERNKMIAAAALGVISLLALFLAFGPSFGGRSSTSTNVSVKTSATPRPGTAPARSDAPVPTVQEQDFVYQTTPVVYAPGQAYAPDAGRNIFSFYEPPPPCRDCPTPTPIPSPIKTPTPAPTPPLFIAGASPQMVYAGSQGFKLDISGNDFPAGTRIYFNQTELPTKQVAANRLTADVPAAQVAFEGPKQIIVQTPDGKMYSNQLMLSVQAPPKPTVQYIGMIARKRYNNDTAYFIEPGKDKPLSARLNDVVAGRFRLINISASEVIFEDTTLPFKYKVPLTRTASGTASAGQPISGFPQGVPGIPANVPRYVPPPGTQKDVDDDDGPPRP